MLAHRLFLGSVGFALAACTPATGYRNAALSPATALPSFDGRTAEEGTLRAEGSVHVRSVEANPAPRAGDSALWVPAVEANGVLALALSDTVEVGVRGAFAESTWLTKTALGTPPLATTSPYAAFGPELRATLFAGSGHGFALGMLANAMMASVPTSAWAKTSLPCTDATRCFVDPVGYGTLAPGPVTYALVGRGSTDVLALSAFLYPSFALGESGGHVFLAIGASSSFRNDGFTENPKGVPIESAGLARVFGLGYGVRLSGVRLALAAYLPPSGAAQDGAGPGVSLTIGGDLVLWQSASAAKAPSRAPLPVRDIERRSEEAQGELEVR